MTIRPRTIVTFCLAVWEETLFRGSYTHPPIGFGYLKPKKHHYANGGGNVIFPKQRIHKEEQSGILELELQWLKPNFYYVSAVGGGVGRLRYRNRHKSKETFLPAHRLTEEWDACAWPWYIAVKGLSAIRTRKGRGKTCGWGPLGFSWRK